ncbi:hypothetical protein N657DRAFT_576429 [Parathielavia appendiculata]|uniref:Protein kinase domain-containing protein n=1 Tax=Parathielavia appendiculata TaxID=2587402 RepID=A0AAN6TW89_9PEZI|nr:hypothetical protein N657DRAFT_576429 [Parathielavia appendiculata]
MGDGGLEQMWWDLPFGSVITVDLPVPLGGGREEEVAMVARYGVEQGMLGVEKLEEMWKGDVVSWDGVEVVEWERLRFGMQMHEVISLVTVDGLAGEEEVVFKSVLQEQRYMYNELKILLSLEAHPNVISRPIGVVTKKGRFGSRRGVCGFLLEWFPLGSLRERLLGDDYDTTTSMTQRLRWAWQVTEAFVHINRHKQAGFYPDLKPDNIVLREDRNTGMLDAVLIDLEQRGGWFAWSPPEVAYVEYLEMLADGSGLPDGELKEEIVEQLKAYYDDPDWLPGTGSHRYRNNEGGFSLPWLALLKQRQAGGEGRDLLEKAQVFMLGKLLWCIFEGQAMVRCGIDHEILRDVDPDYESRRLGKARAFPEFRRTPEALRALIRACTAGAPEWNTQEPRLPGVVLRGGKLYPADSGAGLAATSGDTRAAVKRFWAQEVEQARIFMCELLAFRGKLPEGEPTRALQRPASVSSPTLLEQVQTRPRFSAILDELTRIERSL